MRILIVDDELLACERIRKLLEHEANIEIVGEYHDGRAAIAAIRELSPDLVFLDVQMPEMGGLEVLEKLDLKAMPVIIFVTAFDQYAIKAFEFGALDYLLKPFDRQRFHKALERGRADHAKRSEGNLDRKLLLAMGEWQKRSKYVERLVIRSSGRVFFLRVDEIDWIEAQGNYLKLHIGNEEYMHRETMTRMESSLDPDKFSRIHRSTIVNLERIKELQPLFHGDYRVLLRDGQELTLGKNYRDRLKV